MDNKKKIFLIYPAFSSGLAASVSPCLLSLAAHISEHNPNLLITIWDERMDGEFEPNDVEGALFAISAMTAQASRAKHLAEMVKEAGSFGVVFGGIHPTVCPAEFLDYGAVVQGEIEGGSFGRVLFDYENGRKLDKTYFTPPAPLKNLPLAPLEFYEYAARGADELVSDARGCPFGCSYCSVHLVAGKKIRYRLVDEVIMELKTRNLLNGNPNKQVSFTNDSFGILPQDRKLLQRIKKELDGKDFNWFTQIGINPLNDDSFLELINSVGHSKLAIGLESPFREGLSIEKKGMNGINLLSIFDKIRKYPNIKTRLLLMLGFDFEPIDAFEQMLEFIRQLRPDGVYISILTPFPGTNVATRLEGEGRLFHKNWTLYDTRHLVFERRFKKNGKNFGIMTPEEFMNGYNWLVEEAGLEIRKWSRFHSQIQVL